jgi:glycine C-acetyltransferase
VIYPVIPKGLIMLRIIPTATHSLEDVQRTLDAFTEVRVKLEQGRYKEKANTVV